MRLGNTDKSEKEDYLAKNGESIKEQLRTRKYKPQPVRRVEIPKPNGGVRNLGVLAVTDRFIQQAIAQVLTPIYEEQFHDHSYGFRPNKCAQQAILTALDMRNDGNDWIVDIDLEKFFDTVNHDMLMTIIGRTIKDGDVIIKEYLIRCNNVVYLDYDNIDKIKLLERFLIYNDCMNFEVVKINKSNALNIFKKYL